MRCLQRRPIRAQKESGNREKAWSMLQGNTKKGKKQKPLQQGLLTENLAPPAGFEPVACRLGVQKKLVFNRVPACPVMSEKPWNIKDFR